MEGKSIHHLNQSSHPASAITDRFGRQFSYVRIAINERCNLRCIYCMPEDKSFPTNASLLQTAEINRLVDIVTQLGVSKVRFTGGEPLLHPHLPQMIAHSARRSTVSEVHLTTNGVLLAQRLDTLIESGLTGVNISIDTLNPDRFLAITRRDQLHRVREGIDAALESNLSSVKLNVVSLRHINDQDINQFVQWTVQHPITVRFIELMPFDDKQIWKTGKFVRTEHLEERIRHVFPTMITTTGSATEHRVLQLPNAQGKIALIPSYSRQLCSQCNRFRITADGKIRNCLYAQTETDILSLLRNGSDDQEIALAIRTTMNNKLKDGWVAQRATSPQSNRTSMSQIGG